MPGRSGQGLFSLIINLTLHYTQADTLLYIYSLFHIPVNCLPDENFCLISDCCIWIYISTFIAHNMCSNCFFMQIQESLIWHHTRLYPQVSTENISVL